VGDRRGGAGVLGRGCVVHDLPNGISPPVSRVQSEDLTGTPAPLSHLLGTVGLVSTVAEQKEELAEWLWHDEGYSSARVELARARLPKDDQAVFDVLGETAVRILGRLERSGSIDDHPDGRSGVGPYARRTLHHVVIDAVRGPRHRLEVLVDDLTAEADQVDVTDVETVALDAVARPSLRHEVRHGLHSSLDHRAPWVAAAALTVVTVADDSAPDLPEGTPQPEGGEGAPYWAGLHLAGRTDCFTRPDTGAVRERRRRAVGRVRGLLQRVTREIQQAASR